MKKLLLVITMSVVSVAGAWAAPTVQVKGGETHLLFSADASDQLAFRGVESEAVEPASVRPDSRKLRLRVQGGLIDLETVSGEINHVGGVRVMSVDGEKLSLQGFRIDTMGESSVISAIATVNGSILERIEMFELQRNETSEVDLNERGSKLRIRNLDIVLTVGGVRYLNQYFGTAFEAGTIVGTANAKIKLRRYNDDERDGGRERDREDRNSDDERDSDNDRDSDDGLDSGSDDDSDSDDEDDLALG
jgi:hypothetical protein